MISLNIGQLDRGLFDISPVNTAPVNVPETRKEATTEFGVSGTPILGGFLRELGEYNPELVGHSAILRYEEMRRSDGQVAATLSAMKLPIRGAEWSVTAPDDPTPAEQEAADFVQDCLFNECDFDGIVENALLMLDFGFAAHEDVFYISGDQIRLRKCAPRLPVTCYRWVTNNDGPPDLIQMGYQGSSYKTVQIPGNKLALFTLGQEGDNYTGRSLCRPMYKHWYMKTALEIVEAIASERNGMGIPVITMAANATSNDRRVAEQWLQSLSVSEKTGLLNPPGWTFELVGVKGQVHSALPTIEYHDSKITKAALAQFMDLGGGHSGGNRALGQTMSDFFYLSLQALASSIARVLTETTCKRLCDLNFAGLTRYPKISVQKILSTKIETAVDALTKLAAGTVNVIQPDDDLEAWIRQDLGAPPASKPRPRPASGGEGGAPKAGPDLSASEAAPPASAPKLSREPRGVEKFMALSAIVGTLDQGQQDIAAALRAARPRLQKEIVQKLMSRPAAEAHRVSIGLDEVLVTAVRSIMDGISDYGHKSVTEERARQLRAGGQVPTAATVRASAAGKKQDLGVYADGIVSEFSNNLQARAANVVLDQRRTSKSTGQQILDAEETLDEQSDGWIDGMSYKGANEAFADGRQDGYEAYAEEIGEVLYSALLDPNTCDQCSSADGESGATPDDITAVPNPDCDGGDKCRCVHVFVFADEGKAVK